MSAKGGKRLAIEPAADVTTQDFIALYERCVGEVYSYLMSRVGDRSTAEDLTQEVFLAGLARARAGEVVGVAWFIAVARNKLVDHWRARSRDERKLALLVSQTGPPEEDMALVVDLGAAASALAEMNPTYRAALVLRHVDGLLLVRRPPCLPSPPASRE